MTVLAHQSKQLLVTSGTLGYELNGTQAIAAAGQLVKVPEGGAWLGHRHRHRQAVVCGRDQLPRRGAARRIAHVWSAPVLARPCAICAAFPRTPCMPGAGGGPMYHAPSACAAMHVCVPRHACMHAGVPHTLWNADPGSDLIAELTVTPGSPDETYYENLAGRCLPACPGRGGGGCPPVQAGGGWLQ